MLSDYVSSVRGQSLHYTAFRCIRHALWCGPGQGSGLRSAYLHKASFPVVEGGVDSWRCTSQGLRWHTGIEQTLERGEADVELLSSLP